MDHAHYVAYFQTDLDADPMISVTAGPNNAGLSVYE